MSSQVIIILTILLAFILYVLAIHWLFFSSRSIKSILSGAPPVPTPKKEIIFALRGAKLSTGDKFYDLGSGTGKGVILADKKFNAEAIGVECSLFFYIFSKLNIFLNQSNGKIIKDNFLSTDLSNADIIYIYTSKELMERLEKKIINEKLEAKIVSYCFKFPNLNPKKILKAPNDKIIYIYQTKNRS